MRVKMSKQPPPAPTVSAVGPCPTVIQIVGRPGTGSLPSTIAPPDHPPEVQRGQAIALLIQGQRQQQVARHFGVQVSTIERLVRRLREKGRVADRPRSGRPRVTSQRQDRAIRLAHLRNRHLTATETAVNTVGSHNRRIHPKTVRNRLREFGLRSRRPNVGLPLNRARRARRIAWVTAQAPRRFPMRQCFLHR